MEINDNIEVINKSKSQMLYKRISKVLHSSNSKLRSLRNMKVAVSIPLLFVGYE
jgi:hypothetical protein